MERILKLHITLSQQPCRMQSPNVCYIACKNSMALWILMCLDAGVLLHHGNNRQHRWQGLFLSVGFTHKKKWSSNCAKLDNLITSMMGHLQVTVRKWHFSFHHLRINALKVNPSTKTALEKLKIFDTKIVLSHPWEIPSALQRKMPLSRQ